MMIKKFTINDNPQLFQEGIFEVLSCDLMWIMKWCNQDIALMTTNHLNPILMNHYIKEKYYLLDPDLNSAKITPISNVTIGSNYEIFHKTSFIHTLNDMFDIKEFVSTTIRGDQENYCFRFFSKSDRFQFLNKFLQNKPILEYFVGNIINQIETSNLAITQIN